MLMKFYFVDFVDVSNSLMNFAVEFNLVDYFA